jgi:hypothetical protein
MSTGPNLFNALRAWWADESIGPYMSEVPTKDTPFYFVIQETEHDVVAITLFMNQPLLQEHSYAWFHQTADQFNEFPIMEQLGDIFAAHTTFWLKPPRHFTFREDGTQVSGMIRTNRVDHAWPHRNVLQLFKMLRLDGHGLNHYLAGRVNVSVRTVVADRVTNSVTHFDIRGSLQFLVEKCRLPDTEFQQILRADNYTGALKDMRVANRLSSYVFSPFNTAERFQALQQGNLHFDEGVRETKPTVYIEIRLRPFLLGRDHLLNSFGSWSRESDVDINEVRDNVRLILVPLATNPTCLAVELFAADGAIPLEDLKLMYRDLVLHFTHKTAGVCELRDLFFAQVAPHGVEGIVLKAPKVLSLEMPQGRCPLLMPKTLGRAHSDMMKEFTPSAEDPNLGSWTLCMGRMCIHVYLVRNGVDETIRMSLTANVSTRTVAEKIRERFPDAQFTHFKPIHGASKEVVDTAYPIDMHIKMSDIIFLGGSLMMQCF